jgi:hypothetical protein
VKNIFVLVGALLFSAMGLADNDGCHIHIRHGLQVTPESMRVMSADVPVYQIGAGGHLSIHGEAVELSPEQRKLAAQYTGDMAALIHQWIDLVSDAMAVSQSSLEQAFAHAFGEKSVVVEKSGRVLARAREHLEKVAYSRDGVYILDAEKYNNLDRDLDKGFEKDLDVVLASLRAVLVELIGAMTSDEGSFEENMEAFGERMELMGTEMQVMGDSLGTMRDVLCEQVQAVQKLEQKVVKAIPELAQYPVFER